MAAGQLCFDHRQRQLQIGIVLLAERLAEHIEGARALAVNGTEKRRVGSRVFFKGNIDPVNTLLKMSREQVRADALWRLSVGSPGGGYILSSACSVSPRVPPENLTVLVEASRQFAGTGGASSVWPCGRPGQ